MKFRKIRPHLVFCLTCSTLIFFALYGWLTPAQAKTNCTHYVSTTGNDTTGDGSETTPWASITYAVNNTSDGCTIIVKSGTYTDQVALDRVFTQGITVTAEVPYLARLRYDGTVVRSYYGKKITMEGFDIAHQSSSAGALVIQIQDLLGDFNGDNGGSDAQVSDIVLRNNILHDSYNNDVLKINNGAGNITVEGNMFYNQSGSDEHIDVNSVTDVIIQDNIFFNDFAGSGRTNNNDTSGYIVIKDSNGTDDTNLGSKDITVRRNIFLNWEGSTGSNFVLVGEDGNSYFEAENVLVENNLMLGNSSNVMRAPFGVKGGKDITFRNNTVVGDMPALAFAMRLNTEGSNPANENILFYNNIWSDPTGTMGSNGSGSNDFSDTPIGETTSFTLDNNLFWNGGATIPSNPTNDTVNFTNDANRIEADPLLGDQTSLIVPRWHEGSSQFAGGSTTIRAAFEKLVTEYGSPSVGSPVLGAANATQAPSDDILGNARGSSPSIGASEGSLTLNVSPTSQAIDVGAMTNYQIDVSSTTTDTITLQASTSSTNVEISLSITSLTPPGQATLTVTSTHVISPLIPGEFITLPITATGGGFTQTTSATLLVGGAQLHLPVVLK